MTAETKRCPTCGEVKPVDEFYPSRRDRLSSECKPCARARAKASMRRRRDQDPASSREATRRHRLRTDPEMFRAEVARLASESLRAIYPEQYGRLVDAHAARLLEEIAPQRHREAS